MNKYFVCQDSMCPGTEFNTYGEAYAYLNEMRRKDFSAWYCARIYGPGLD